MSASLTLYITGHGQVGHAYIGLTDSNGKTEYWGYYPDAAFSPDAQREGVEFLENGTERIYGPGCLANDEKTFENYDKVPSAPIELSEQQYHALHEYIQNLKENEKAVAGSTYSFVGNNCVDFANEALKVVGQPGDIGDFFGPEQIQDANLAGLYLSAKYGDHHLNPSGEVPSGEGIYNRTEWATGIPDHPSADDAKTTAHDETKNADPAASPSAPDATVDHTSQPEPQIEEKAPNQEPLPPESLTADPQEPVGQIENIDPPQETGTIGGSDAPTGYNGTSLDPIQNQYGVPSGVIVDPADEPIIEKPDFVESKFTVKDPEVMIAEAKAIEQGGMDVPLDDLTRSVDQTPNVVTPIPDPSEVWNNQITGNVTEPPANEPQGNGVVSTPDTETSPQAASTTEPSTSWAAQISGNVAEPVTDQPQSSSWVDMVSQQSPPAAEPPPPAPDTWAHTVAPPPPEPETTHAQDNTHHSWVDSVSHDSGATHDHGSSPGSHGSSPDV